jgi:hypothetical protein
MFDDKYLDCFDDENEILMEMRPAWQRIEEYIEMRELRSQLNDPGFHF